MKIGSPSWLGPQHANEVRDGSTHLPNSRTVGQMKGCEYYLFISSENSHVHVSLHACQRHQLSETAAATSIGCKVFRCQRTRCRRPPRASVSGEWGPTKEDLQGSVVTGEPRPNTNLVHSVAVAAAVKLNTNYTFTDVTNSRLMLTRPDITRPWPGDVWIKQQSCAWHWYGMVY